MLSVLSKIPIFPSIILKFNLQLILRKKENSSFHDGTLWIEMVTFPSDRTSKLLQEKYIEKKNINIKCYHKPL